jgi:hypothetical protein
MTDQLATIHAEADRLRSLGYRVSLKITEPGEPDRRKTPRYTPEDEKCARWIYGLTLNVLPSKKPPTWSSWAEDVRRMRENDGRTHREIYDLFQWANNDKFWRANVLCPKTLREKWDRLAAQSGTKPQAGGGKFNFTGADRAADRAAQQQSMAKHGVTIPDEEVRF